MSEGLIWAVAVALVLVAFAAYFLGKSARSAPPAAVATGLSAISDDFSDGIELAVAGESFQNPDGTSRQRIIAGLKIGEHVQLVREPHNEHDRNAIRIDTRLGCIGYVARGDAASISSQMDGGKIFKAKINNIAGGHGDRPSRGVWLLVQQHG